MGCKGSKHALHGCGCSGLPAAPRPQPEPQQRRRGSCSSGRLLAPPTTRHSVALRSSTLGTLSLDRAAAAVAAAGLSFDAAAAGGGGGGGEDEAIMKAGNDVVDGTKLLGPSRSFAGWCPKTPPPVAAPPAQKRKKRVAAAAASRVVAPPPRTPTKTPARDPEEINVWELMKGLDDDDDEAEEEEDQETDTDDGCVVDGAGGAVDRKNKAQSAPGSPSPVFDPEGVHRSPVFDMELLDAFRKALDGLTTTPGSPLPLPPADPVKRDGGGGGDDVVVEKRAEIQTFPGIVRARVDVFQEKINAKTKLAAKKQASPPDSAGRVVVYLTSLRGIRQTYEDCWSTSAILRGYGVRVDERDLSMHAGFKAELRAALGGNSGEDGGHRLVLPQVFADGRHLGGAEEVRRLHEAGELASALDACDAAAPPCATKGAQVGACCAGCGGVRFVPCERCSGSCKVFVEDDEDGGSGAFRRCPECNENGLVKCPVCLLE